MLEETNRRLLAELAETKAAAAGVEMIPDYRLAVLKARMQTEAALAAPACGNVSDVAELRQAILVFTNV